MELIVIDSIRKTIPERSKFREWLREIRTPRALFLDTETGVVYLDGKYPRYDSNGNIMVIPKEHLSAVINNARTQIAAEYTEWENEDRRRKPTKI